MTNRKAQLFFLAGGLFLSAASTCDSSAHGYVAPEHRDPAADVQRVRMALDDGAPASAAERAEWSELRERYQRAIRRHGAAAVGHALIGARMIGSATLASDEGARQRFSDAVATASELATYGRLPTFQDATQLAAMVTGPDGRVRTAGVQSMRARSPHIRYAPGATARAAAEALFAALPARAMGTNALPEVAARFDQQLIGIHPFVDGNGRTTRLMTDWVLATGGYPPVVQTRTADAAWQGGPGISPTAHLERISEGMRTSVRIAEALA